MHVWHSRCREVSFCSIIFEPNDNIRVTLVIPVVAFGSNKSKARSSNRQSTCRRYGTHVLMTLSGSYKVAYDDSKICLLCMQSGLGIRFKDYV